MSDAAAAGTEGEDDDAVAMSSPRFVVVDGVRTRYFDVGSPALPTLVLIHGGDFDYREVASATEWLPNVGPLSRQFRVIAFDKLGCGLTDSPAAARDYTIAAVVAHARRLLDVLGLTDVVLWGHSRGALAALRVALEAPELVRQLVLSDSNSVAPEDPSIPRGFYTRVYPSADAVATPQTLRELFDAVSFDPRNRHVEAVYRRKLAELEEPHPARPMTSESIAAMRAAKREHFDSHLLDYKHQTLEMVRTGGLRARTLVLWGFNDPTVSARVGFDLYQRLALYASDVEFHLVNRVGHYPQTEDPATVHRVVSSFLAAGFAGSGHGPEGSNQ